ncbi:MAG TPA: copper resistance CopC family protein [Anaerolineae bacterium]|nr:copper resistance CopC family protein [Anaerolineae bacterium]
MRWWWLFIGSLVCLFGVGGVRGHQMLVGMEPEAGASLALSPREVRLWFERPLGGDSTFVILNSQFVQVAGVDVRQDMAKPEVLWAEMPLLEPDTYTVQWVAIDTDGHPTSGSYQFTLLAGAIPQTTGLPLGGGELGVALIGVIIFLALLVGWRRWLGKKEVVVNNGDDGRGRPY